jgi:hypothetical protein
MGLRVFILCLACFTLIPGTFAQRWKLTRYEVFGGAGTANGFGDIGGSADANNLYGLKDIRIDETRLSLTAGARYKVTERMAVRMNFIYGSIVSDDQGSRNENRQFSYKTSIFEPSALFEYHIIPEDKRFRSSSLFNRRGMINNYSKVNVYAFTGLAPLYFKPTLYGENIEDTRLPSEYSGYSSFTLAIPLGLGLKYVIDSRWSAGFEIGGRYTFTDYLDGFGSRFSKNNDIYYFTSLSVMYKLKTNRRGYPVIFQR